ncbi:UNVERIFIED_CONTAM: hypothetical protein Sradi_7174700 [Sesamum radiatum]|uniref:Reverse transcriptase Ty1/copia-type domain-containing protein n=1 Tax=Sesamum radiatum TaxID=300843 RepID=A0AAW2IVE7_SESRA
MMSACIAKEKGIGIGSAHNSSPTQVLEKSRRLSKDEMILRLDEGKVVAAEVVGSLSLVVSDRIWIEFKEYRLEVENQTDRKIKTLRSYQVFLEKGFHEDNRQDEVLFEESSETPQHNDATSFEPSVPTDGVPVLCKSIRESRPPERYGFIRLISQLDNDPRTYGQAMSDIDLDKWLEAMKSEMDSRVQIKFVLVNSPKGVSLVGEVTAFKAKLVAKGYTKRPEVDFEETYSPVAMAKSTRILLPITA